MYWLFEDFLSFRCFQLFCSVPLLLCLFIVIVLASCKHVHIVTFYKRISDMSIVLSPNSSQCIQRNRTWVSKPPHGPSEKKRRKEMKHKKSASTNSRRVSTCNKKTRICCLIFWWTLFCCYRLSVPHHIVVNRKNICCIWTASVFLLFMQIISSCAKHCNQHRGSSVEE